ncbi:hypothetical protein SAMN05660691_04175 [Rheinheimera pacifica]|uniref:Uncharacterized protein n=1 Tax=Rheinheimera pacifica TaxID=173990 RepID=A0A1H6NFX8_9GAMM|nr:hypothetical protein [Rheinheimera pacifica]SEI14170.1 hypothetical protein SAMN05660691_04175 [Rheinheimera pacifica]
MLNTETDTTCYAVFADISNYAMLQESTLELLMQIDDPVGFYGEPLAHIWKSMRVTWFYNPEEKVRPKPDIAALGSTAFAASAETCEKLRPYIGDYVEFLPLDLEGEQWYVIHVLAREDIFNDRLSERKIRDDGTPSRIWKKVVLNTDRIADGVLFRIKGLTLGIFSTDRPDSFKSVVKRLGLTGMTYQVSGR